MARVDHDERLRMLVRHQWVREHGTPRITTMTGSVAACRRLWSTWIRLSGRGQRSRGLFEQPAQAPAAWLDRTAAHVSKLVVDAPREPVAIAVAPVVLERWLARRPDRVAALVAEGVVPVDRGATATPPPPRVPRAPAARDTEARSLAELTLFEALEATPSTTGRFQLNQAVSFHFGPRAAEIDLLSRQDAIAIEVDGYHHFTDRERYRRDRRKDVLLQAHGYAVLRFLADDVLADPRDAVRLVVEVLARRRRR